MAANFVLRRLAGRTEPPTVVLDYEVGGKVYRHSVRVSLADAEEGAVRAELEAVD